MKDDKGSKMLIEFVKEPWGGVNVFGGPLNMEVFTKVNYVPRTRSKPSVLDDDAWGLFDSDGFIMEGSVYRRGINFAPVSQKLTKPKSCPSNNIFSAVLYGGLIHSEYGHCILSLFSKLWSHRLFLNKMKVLFHSHLTVNELFNIPFIRDIFNAMGLDKHSCIIPTEETIISEVYIPQSAFTEQHSGHRSFCDVANAVGTSISNSNINGSSFQKHTAIYLTKERLSFGVRNISNEAELSQLLADRGFLVVYPELLKLGEQIDLFRRSKVVCGVLGSAFHTSCFVPNCGNLLAITHLPAVNSNFLIIDKLNSNFSSYIYSNNLFSEELPHHGFSQTLRLNDVKGLANWIGDFAHNI